MSAFGNISFYRNKNWKIFLWRNTDRTYFIQRNEVWTYFCLRNNTWTLRAVQRCLGRLRFWKGRRRTLRQRLNLLEKLFEWASLEIFRCTETKIDRVLIWRYWERIGETESKKETLVHALLFRIFCAWCLLVPMPDHTKSVDSGARGWAKIIICHDFEMIASFWGPLSIAPDREILGRWGWTKMQT